MSAEKNKTLSVVVTHDSVFFIVVNSDLIILQSGHKEIFDFISCLHAGDFLYYALKIVNVGNKFLFSDNDKFLENEDYITGCTKFTGQNIYVKFIQHFSELKAGSHISALMDHHYYLKERDVIHLHFEKDMMYVYIKQNGLFMLFNIYEIGNVEDVLYFCNLSFDTLNDQVKESNKWILSGKIDVNSQIHKSIIRYFPEFNFAHVPLRTGNTDEKGHYYFFHYLNLICGS